MVKWSFSDCLRERILRVLTFPPLYIWSSRRKLYGLQVGGIRETQEMLDNSVANNLHPRVEIIPIQKLDEAYQNVLAGKVKFRYVIDMSTLT
jgi:alcohol dehydrogenase (NADP+)